MLDVEVSADQGHQSRQAARGHPAAGRSARAQGQSRPRRPTASSSRPSSTRAAARSRPCWSSAARCKVGDIVVAGAEWGRVRALIDDRGEQVKEAGPSMPVEVLGLDGTPQAGDRFAVVENEARAREITDYRAALAREKAGAPRRRRPRLARADDDAAAGAAASRSFRGHQGATCRARSRRSCRRSTSSAPTRSRPAIIHAGVGGITEADVTLAEASGAPIIGFNVRANAQARDARRARRIEIRYYNIIYNLVDDIKAAMSGLLAPERRETFLGNAEILRGLQHHQGRQGRRLPGHRRHGRARRRACA